MKEQQQQATNHTADSTEVESLSQEQQQQQLSQLSQIVASTFHTEAAPTTSTYEQPVTEDGYSQEVGEYEGEQNEAEYYEEFETSVVQPEEQVQVEIVGVEVRDQCWCIAYYMAYIIKVNNLGPTLLGSFCSVLIE